MAIQTDLIQSQFGIPFSAAYFRISLAAVSRVLEQEKHRVMIDIVGYAAIPQSDDMRDVDFRRYHVVLSEIEAQQGDTFLSKCYKWVMQQPDMDGCIAI